MKKFLNFDNVAPLVILIVGLIALWLNAVCITGCGGGGGDGGNVDTDNGWGNDVCLPGQGCAIFPDMNQPDQPKGCTFWAHECGVDWHLKWICENGQCVPDPNECYLDEDCKEGKICALTKPQKCVDDSVLEPYRWVEGDWTCTDTNGATELIGKTKTVEIKGWAGDDKGAEVSTFGVSTSKNYVLKQSDGTFTYVGLNHKDEVVTNAGLFKFDDGKTTLNFDLTVGGGAYYKYQKE